MAQCSCYITPTMVISDTAFRLMHAFISVSIIYMPNKLSAYG
jgi:hypothetical protein